MSICQSSVEHEVNYIWNRCGNYDPKFYQEPDKCEVFPVIKKDNAETKKEVNKNEISN